MSVKVLIVDDEKLERVLISNSVEWEKNGFEVIGEAGNGEEALEFFDMNQPDLILTDINMPFMDGVTFAQHIRERSKNCHIIMLTGYREFEYARKAVALGVDEFLVKPINAMEVTRAAVASREKIKTERGADREMAHLKQEAIGSRLLLRDAFLQRLLEQRVEEEEALHKLQMFQLTRLLAPGVCVSVNVRVTDGGQKQEVCTYILEWCRKHTTAVVCFLHYLNHIVLFYGVEDSARITGEMQLLLEEMKERNGCVITVGVSEEGQGLSAISKAYQQTQKVNALGMICGGKRLWNYRDYEKIRNRRQKMTEMNWKNLEIAMTGGSLKRVEECVDAYAAELDAAGVPEEIYLKIMAMEIAERMAEVLARQGRSVSDVVGEQQYYRMVTEIDGIAVMQVFLKEVAGRILVQTEGSRTKKGNALVASVKVFIEQNLGNPELSLRLIAQELYMNGSYLSRVFKQETGESLTEYITRKRIEKSMQLMDETSMKAYEIAEQVGIKDAHYFSICFKKYVGVTVKEYKNRER